MAAAATAAAGSDARPGHATTTSTKATTTSTKVVALLTTTGTYLQHFDPETGRMQARAPELQALLPARWRAAHGVGDVCHTDLSCRSGAHLTFATILRARDAVLAAGCASVVLLTGTDTLEVR